MQTSWKTTVLGYAQRQHLRGLALVVFLFALGVALWSGITVLQTQSVEPMTTLVTNSIPGNATTATENEMFEASDSEPRTLRIPSIGVLATFEAPLGLSSDGSIGVPDRYDTVGWYKYGPTPGEMGPAIVIGHMASIDGPGVFFDLKQMNVGDSIEIDLNDGSTAVYAVTRYERVEQDEFPMENVYGNISYAGIRLITCSGTYDKATDRYDRNLIVYGELVEVVTP